MDNKSTLGHGKNPTKGGALTNWRMQTDGQVRTRKESDRGALTSWRVQTDRQVRTQKEFDRARGTHQLESTDGRTSQDTERIQLSEGHSRTGGRRRTDNSGQKYTTERGALTDWRAQMDGRVRTRRESDRARGTHILESAD